MLWAKATGRNVPEETKTAFYRSRRLALVRSLIHLVPFGVALYLVILNWAQYYIGEELQGPSGQDTEKLAALQFAAKLHELLILASLGTVLFSCVRHTLAFGEGVTLGELALYLVPFEVPLLTFGQEPFLQLNNLGLLTRCGPWNSGQRCSKNPAVTMSESGSSSSSW